VLEAKIAKNVALHRKKIESEIEDLKNDVHGHEFFQAGEDVAKLLETALGSVEAPAPEMVGLPVKAAPLFVGGFLKEFV